MLISWQGTTQTYTMDDTTARAFQLLVQWLYNQELSVAQLDDEELVSPAVARVENLALAELWVLAEKLMLFELQVLVMDKLAEIDLSLGRFLPHTIFDAIYEGTERGCDLRCFAVERFMAVHMDDEHREYLLRGFCSDMVVDVAIAAAAGWQRMRKDELEELIDSESSDGDIVEISDSE